MAVGSPIGKKTVQLIFLKSNSSIFPFQIDIFR